MDLKHDWKALNEILFQQQGPMSMNASSLVLLEDNDAVVDGVASNGRAFADRGVSGVSSNKEMLDELATKYGTEQTLVLSKKLLDQVVVEAAQFGTNYYQQLQMLRSRVLEQVGDKKNGMIVSRRHFLLDLFGVQLKRMLPRRYNVLLFIDNRAMLEHGAAPFSFRAILLSYNNGQLDQFFEPDFASLNEQRLKNWSQESDAIGEYLESRYILPCYGIFMHKENWERCLELANQKRRPWVNFAKLHDGGQARVYPKGFISKSLLASQRLMAYFGRL